MKNRKDFEILRAEMPAPMQKDLSGYDLNPVRWQMPKDRIERITNLRRGELERMQVYMGSQDCLMQFLAEELNDPDAGPCGKCVNCAGDFCRRLPGVSCPGGGGVPRPPRNSDPPRKRWPRGLTILRRMGNIAAAQQAQEGRALCRWGDPGPGTPVRQGKQQDTTRRTIRRSRGPLDREPLGPTPHRLG